MTSLYETVPPERRLEVAVLTTGPAGLARAFASYSGQFYNRAEFDALARRASDLYAARSESDASTFRVRLDRRLCDRFRAPVAWGAGAPDLGRAA